MFETVNREIKKSKDTHEAISSKVQYCWFHLTRLIDLVWEGSVMIDVYLTALLSDWLTRQEENSSCKFGALQVIKVGRAGVYYKTGNEKRPTFRKST